MKRLLIFFYGFLCQLIAQGQQFGSITWYNKDFLLPEREVKSIVFDNSGMAWLGCHTSIYAFNGNTFIDVRSLLDNPLLIYDTNFYLSKHKINGHILFANNIGCYEIVPSSIQIGKLHAVLKYTFPKIEVTSKAWDKQGVLWFVQGNKLFQFNSYSKKIVATNISLRFKILQTTSNILYCINNDNGLFKLEGDQIKFIRKFPLNDSMQLIGFNGSHLAAGIQTSKTNYLFDSTADVSNAILIKAMEQHVNVDYMPRGGDYIYFEKDKDGILWACTPKGLVKYNNRGPLILSAEVNHSTRAILYSPLVKKALIAYYNGIAITNETGNKVFDTSLKHICYNAGFMLGNSKAILLPQVGNPQLLQYHFLNHQFKHLKVSLPASFNAVQSINDTTLVIGGSALFRYKIKGDSILDDKMLNGSIPIPNALSSVIMGKMLMVGKNGIFLYQLNDNTYKEIGNASCNAVASFADYWLVGAASGDIYMVTSNGIITLLFKNNTAIFQTLYSLTKNEEKAYVWLGTDNGLFLFNINKKAIMKGFNKSDGFNDNEFNTNSSAVINSKQIWIGGLKGVNYFNTTAIISSDTLKMSFFEVLNNDLDRNIYLASPPEKNHFVFNSSQNSFRLFFTYVGQGDAYLRYKIHNGNTTWQYANKGNVINIYGLEPGTYDVLIDATPNDIATTEIKVFTITILHPWYQTGWAYLMGALLISTFAYLVFISRLHIAKAKAAIAIKRNREQLLLMIAHDLRSPVKMYLSLADTINYLLKKKQFDRLEKLSDQVDATGHNLNLLLNNLLEWSTVNKKKYTTNDSALLNLNEMVDNLLPIYHNIAESYQLKLHLTMPKFINLKMNKLAISAILRNLIDNAIKNAPPFSTVHIIFERKEKELLLFCTNNLQNNDTATIEKLKIVQYFFNNPSAFNNTENEMGIGLNIVSQSVKQLRASVEVLLTEKEVCFKLTIPVIKD